MNDNGEGTTLEAFRTDAQFAQAFVIVLEKERTRRILGELVE